MRFPAVMGGLQICSGMQAVMQSCRGALRVEKVQKRGGHAVTEGVSSSYSEVASIVEFGLVSAS